MYPRTLASHLIKLTGAFPAVFLTGPRQSGKTTLARSTFPEWPYQTLEDLQTRDEALVDPRGFLARWAGSPGLIIDEVQHAPGLLSYLQGFVDERRAGPVILTGSQNLQLSTHISQSLAGRAAIAELLPFSYAERTRRAARSPEALAKDGWSPEAGTPGDLDVELFTGGYPPIHDRNPEPRTWLNSYIHTYVERDVRTLAQVGDLNTFTRFLRLCAGRAGQLVDLTALGADAGIDRTTARRWLSILEASYVIRFLSPHFRNFSKRLVKTPKLYFYDTGLLCALIGLRSPADLSTHPLRGAIFENFVVTELIKLFAHHGERPPLWFWRDHAGHEVDVLIELGETVIPVEAKAGATVASDAFDGLRRYTALAGLSGGVLIHGGEECYLRSGHALQGWTGVS